MTRDVTTEVSGLYEEYPYPGHGVVSAVVANMLEGPLRGLQSALGIQTLRLLDAGCGTGEQALGVRRAFPELEVVGVDLNKVSLEIAKGLSARTALPARFERRNLMEPLDGLGQFDIIVSVGVLHSLATPAQGLRNLRRLASRHTIFLGMVYGAYGKWDSIQIRDALQMICPEGSTRQEKLDVLVACRLAGNTGPIHYLNTLLRRRRFGPRIPMLEAARRVLAGRNAAYQADTFTHVQEEVYTWEQLSRLLDDTGWRFEGWPQKSGMPDDPRQVFTGQALEFVHGRSPLELAAIYERLMRPMNLYYLATPK